MMIRPSLDVLPSFELPESYTIRWYREGDERHWTAIKSLADTQHQAPPDFYERVYGAHRDALGQRQAFLCDGSGEPVGTITAWWFENLGDSSLGKVNWMLIVPRVQGRGLAKPLLTACCSRLALLGHTTAALYTLTSRVAAINLYRSFGFVPLIRHAEDLQSWAETNPLLKRPYKETEYLRGSDIGIDVAALTG